MNDFNQFGHTWQVLLQAEPDFRRQPSDIGRFYVRNSQGDMVPLSTLATIEPSGGPDVIYRYNRFRAIQILGGPAPGYSSGQASDAMEAGRGRDPAAGLRLRMDRHHVPGKAVAGQRGRDLRIRRGAGLPLPGRAL